MRSVWQFTTKHIFRLWSMYFWFLVLVACWPLLGWLMNFKLSKWIESILAFIALITWLAKKLTQLKLHFRFLDIIRAKPKYKRSQMFHQMQLHVHLSKDWHYNLTASGVGLIKLFYTILWALPCLILTGIFWITDTLSELWIVSAILGIIPLFKYYYTYGFAQYIYRDGDNADQMVTVLNSPKLSKLLMRHHVIPYMLLQLEVTLPVTILAIFAEVLIIGIDKYTYMTMPYAEAVLIGTFVMLMMGLAPYLKLTELTYYQELIEQRVKQGSQLYQSIMQDIHRREK